MGWGDVGPLVELEREPLTTEMAESFFHWMRAPLGYSFATTPFLSLLFAGGGLGRGVFPVCLGALGFFPFLV